MEVLFLLNFRDLNMFKFNLLVVEGLWLFSFIFVNFVFDNVFILFMEVFSPRMKCALWSNPVIFRTAWSISKLRPNSTFWLCESRLYAIQIIIVERKWLRARRETTSKLKCRLISSKDAVLGTSWAIMRSGWAFWGSEWSCRLLGIEVIKQSCKEAIEIWVFLDRLNAFT